MTTKPTIAIVPTGGTIQNGLPFVTSSKAGGPLNVLRAQRLHEPVTVRIRREDRDGNPAADGGDEFHEVTLTPEDGLYLLPYMEPGHVPAEVYSSFHLAAERVIEEIDRFSVDTNGRNGLLSDVADLRVEMVIDPDTGGELRRGGETFSMRELVLIANTVNEALAQPDVDACIVTHGTFTTEETAAFLNYTVNSHKPVVVAASQRRHGSIGNDGDWNLWDAVRVAASQEAAGKGVSGRAGRTDLSRARGDQDEPEAGWVSPHWAAQHPPSAVHRSGPSLVLLLTNAAAYCGVPRAGRRPPALDPTDSGHRQDVCGRGRRADSGAD